MLTISRLQYPNLSRNSCILINIPFPSFLLHTPVSKRLHVQKFSYENVFDLYENKLADETH